MPLWCNQVPAKKGIRADTVVPFGDDTPALFTVKMWATEVRRGKESLEGEPRSGHLAAAITKGSIDCVKPMVTGDRQLTINQIPSAICMSDERVRNILHNEFGLIRVSAWWLPPDT